MIQENNAIMLKNGIQKALELYNELPVGYDYMKEVRSKISWRAYGKRYAAFLDNLYRKEIHRRK